MTFETTGKFQRTVGEEKEEQKWLMNHRLVSVLSITTDWLLQDSVKGNVSNANQKASEK